MLAGIPHEITAETLQPAQMAYISRDDFLKFIRENGDAFLQVAQHLGRDCHSAYEVIRSIGLSNSVEEKLARFLVEWSAGGQTTSGGLRVKLALTHEEIAQLIGCSLESVSSADTFWKPTGQLFWHKTKGHWKLWRRCRKAGCQGLAQSTTKKRPRRGYPSGRFLFRAKFAYIFR